MKTAEVLWCYLAHEYQHRMRYLPGGAFGLDQPMWPGTGARRLEQAVRAARQAGRANRGVLWVTKLITRRQWQRRLVDWRFLGKCRSILHKGRWRPLSELSSLWHAQLASAERKDHRALVQEIKSGQIPWPVICVEKLTIVDGRHRAFAAYEARCRHITVFVGRKS